MNDASGRDPETGQRAVHIESISALTLATHDMARAVSFYRALGFRIRYGGEDAEFTSFAVGSGHLNLVLAAPSARWSWWGRAIFYVSNVDALYLRALERGLNPQAPPRDAEWCERFFHLVDPDGHELSFARRIEPV
jgi:catechol 2,3-dioxygenase-like lactoylglutathione lyase family enzyme